CIFVRCFSSAAVTIQNSSPFWTTRNVPLGLVFNTCGLFSSSSAGDAVADGEAFASDCVSAISIEWLSQPQSTAIRLSTSRSLFIDGWQKKNRILFNGQESK